MNIDFEASKKQNEFINTFNTEYLEVLYGGAAGGGKSYILWWLIISKCIEYKGIRIGLARNTLTDIKKNTISTFFELTKNLGISESNYKYDSINGKIEWYNGSVIQFYELRYLPSDPNYDRFGGALLTFGAIEEASGVEEKGKGIFQSRLGRWRNDEFKIKPQLFMTCNPGVNFLYSDFYIPYQKGELESFRKYIPAKLVDNPYISEHYKRNLELTLSDQDRNRLLEGEWNFDSDKTRLLKYDDVLAIYDLPNYNEQKAVYFISADIAFSGDKCIIILWNNLTIERIIHYKGDEPDLEIQHLRETYNVSPRNIVFDSDGVGQYLKGRLRGSYAFVNNARPLNKENYDNLKSQAYFKLAEKIKDGSVKCIDNNLKDELIQEVYEIKSQPLEGLDGKLKLIKKKDVKASIGRSPDISDAMAFRMIFEIKTRSKPF